MAAGALVLASCGRPEPPPPFGFAPAGARAQLALESRFLGEPDAERVGTSHQFLTAHPHPAGSARNRELADWIADQFRAAGLKEVAIARHHLLLPEPAEISVELVSPRPWRASLHEPAVDGDPQTTAGPDLIGVAHHAYSASGTVTAQAVYAGEGEPSDYDWLARQGVDVRGRIVIVRHSGGQRYRGALVWTAQQRGAAGILMYPDRRDTAAADAGGLAGAESRIERGSIAYDFIAPGDPLTPGVASVDGAPRIERVAAASLPAIPSVPISARDARTILQSLGGPQGGDRLRTGLLDDVRTGPGPGVVRMTVRMNERVAAIWTVTATLPGTDGTGDAVIIGNHRDAWIFGGVDPATGTAALLELARSLGALARGGWQPKRSLVFASWDAEEVALGSSTEWGEQNAAWLSERAVAYLNVDSAASGSRFVAGAVPSLMRVIAEAADAVRDPRSRTSVAAAARASRSAERGTAARGSLDEVLEDRLGGGSDYTVFLNHLGIPSADLAFDGPYSVYHTLYDTHQYVARYADPGFLYTTTLVKVLGVAALRLADADALPLDFNATVSAIGAFIREIESRAGPATPPFTEVQAALDELAAAARGFAAARDAALAKEDRHQLAALNRRALLLERAFIDPAGLPGRPWYRHVVHAPARDYAPVVLPGISEATAAADAGRIAHETARFSRILRRARDVLRQE